MSEALAAPLAPAVPGAEFLRSSRALRNALRRAARSNVGLPTSTGVGPTFDARGSKRCCETRAICTRKTRATEDDDPRPEPPPASLPLDDAVSARSAAERGADEPRGAAYPDFIARATSASNARAGRTLCSAPWMRARRPTV